MGKRMERGRKEERKKESKVRKKGRKEEKEGGREKGRKEGRMEGKKVAFKEGRQLMWSLSICQKLGWKLYTLSH